MIEIGLCCDEGYAMPCGVCVTSIFESNKENRVRVHIITNGFKADTTRRFEETAKRYGQQIEIYNVDKSLVEGIEIRNHVSIMAYARLLFSRVLDKSIDKLLYLDCDIIIVEDLAELWATELKDYVCRAVVCGSAEGGWARQKTEESGHPYINSGVLLINIPRWRDEKWGERCIEFARKYPEKFRYNDQDAINYVICKNIGLLPLKYNFRPQYISKEPSEHFTDEYTISTFEEARKAPVIIHYVSTTKPWHVEYYFKRYGSLFRKLLRGSLWADYKFKWKKPIGERISRLLFGRK